MLLAHMQLEEMKGMMNKLYTFLNKTAMVTILANENSSYTSMV